jgi:hypothetical protein
MKPWGKERAYGNSKKKKNKSIQGSSPWRIRRMWTEILGGKCL